MDVSSHQNFLTRTNKAILIELEVLLGFINGRHSLNIRYADDMVVITDTERKLHKLLQKVVKESVKKGLNINCKKTECMVVSKRNRPTSKIRDNQNQTSMTTKISGKCFNRWWKM